MNQLEVFIKTRKGDKEVSMKGVIASIQPSNQLQSPALRERFATKLRNEKEPHESGMTGENLCS